MEEGRVTVVGVDTHKESHSAAMLDELGRLRSQLDVVADGHGYKQLLTWARAASDGPRVWAVEGTGSYGAGLARYLSGEGEVVSEGDRPKRSARGAAGKSDALDAIRVAHEWLSRARHADPRRHGEREAIRVLLTTRAGAVDSRTQALNQLHALVVTAPEPLRAKLRHRNREQLVLACQRLRPSRDLETTITATALRRIAHRAAALDAEAADSETELKALVTAVAPSLLAQPGVGVITAAQFLVSWSHSGRLSSEAAFASLAGVAPIPASSGQTVRHRLSHFGDRQLNRALHLVVLSRSRCHAATQAYIARRTAEGKSAREIRRCLKRYLARRLFRLLTSLDMT